MEDNKSQLPLLSLLFIGMGDEFKNFYIKNMKRIIAEYPNIHYHIIEKDFIEEIKKLKGQHFDIVCAARFTAQYVSLLLQTCPSIKWFHALAAGIEDFLKVDELIKNDKIIFSNSKGVNSDVLAESGISCMMYFSYHFYSYTQYMQKKEWIKPTNRILNKKTLLIYGYGSNGISIAKKCKSAFEMKVIGVNRTKRDNVPGKEYTDELYTFKELPDDAINRADFIYATLPSSPETDNIFDKNFFSKMNKEAIFINIGRGSSVVEDDLADALEKKIIRGAVLDVCKTEPLNKDSRLYNISPENLLITNHSLCQVIERTNNFFECFLENFKSYIKTGKLITFLDKKNKEFY